MKTTIGRVVIYKTTEADQELMKITPNCNVAEELPALIVAVHSDECVNLKVIADGELDIWVTSAQKGDEPMNWDFPELVPSAAKLDPKGFFTPEVKKEIVLEVQKSVITPEIKAELIGEVTEKVIDEVKKLMPTGETKEPEKKK
ncbi:MAG: hypothetical protein JEY96_16865 [Bacteroidales bacterium]|nr:hypothetical protein [Bacteroidales bacterium]